MKKVIAVFCIVSLLAVGLAACGSGATATHANPNTIHMNADSFTPTSVTIAKGSSLTLVDDVSVPHVIQNGTWDNGSPKPMSEAGAPTVNLTFTGGDSQSIGPFTTVGTYHLFCTVHSGMSLTVIVQ